MLHADFPGDVRSEGNEHPLENVVFEPEPSRSSTT